MAYRIDPPKATLEKLSNIIEFYRLPGDSQAETLRQVASALSKHLAKKQNWTWNYIHQVINSKLKPSYQLQEAIDLEYGLVSGLKVIHYERVAVMAPVGYLSESTVVNIQSRKCPFCQQFFIPSVYNQKYCSESCRSQKRKILRKESS